MDDGVCRYEAAIDTYKAGLNHFPNDNALKDGLKAAQEVNTDIVHTTTTNPCLFLAILLLLLVLASIQDGTSKRTLTKE